MSEPVFEPALRHLADVARVLIAGERTDESRERLANLAHAFGGLATVIQELAPEHDQAGYELSCLAEECQRAIHEETTR